jgi:FKBP-type peptidyl-prolyl cis-trans isomerase SlyD
MQVADNMAVSIHYTLTNDDGEVLDSSIGDEALVYLHGGGNIISGLEKRCMAKLPVTNLMSVLPLKMLMAN